MIIQLTGDRKDIDADGNKSALTQVQPLKITIQNEEHFCPVSHV